jgi:hypothetical protein
MIRGRKFGGRNYRSPTTLQQLAPMKGSDQSQQAIKQKLAGCETEGLTLSLPRVCLQKSFARDDPQSS